MMLDCKFAMSDGTGEIKLLALINSDALFNFMYLSMAKLLGWAIRPNNTPVAVKLANVMVVCNASVATRLVWSGV